MAENNGAKRVFFIIGMVLLSIVLCYFSIVLYFYFARPYDITGKLSVWNLMNDNEIGEMYLEATYDIRYEEEDFVGVNIDKSGYVLTCEYNFENYNDEEILLYHNSGAVYRGELVFSNEVLNLSILKISDYFDENIVLSLPYVKTGGLSSSIFGGDYLAIGSPFEDGNITSASNVQDSIGYVTTIYDGYEVVDFICLDSVSYTVANYENTSQGALFDRSGRLVGLTYAYAINEDNISSADYYAVSTSSANIILEKLKSGENLDIEITGFDMRELYIYQLFEVNENQIYFNGSLLTLDNALINYYNSGDGVYLTEAFSLNSVTLEENNLITSVSYNGYSQSVTTLNELYTTLYSLDEGTTFTLTSIDLSTNTVIRTEFVI